MNTRFKGKIAENKAVEFLKNKNFKILKTNFYTKFGEIDIIAFKDNVYPVSYTHLTLPTIA
jgi:putative endonuclease